MNHRIEIQRYSRETGLPESIGAVDSQMLPRVGECIQYKGDVYTVSKVVYDFDATAYSCVQLLVVPSR